MTVINLRPSEFIEWRLNFSDSIFDKLFVLMTLSPDNLIRATYVSGNKVYDSLRPHKFLYASEIRHYNHL